MDFFALIDQKSQVEKPSAVMNMEFKHIQQGMFVRIIYLPKSQLNVYKGYKGEIKEYKQGKNYALITLLGVLNFPTIKLPLDHFVIDSS